MQENFLQRVKAAAVKRGYEISDRPQWANTGMIQFLRPDFDVAATLSYSFQTGYASIGIGKGAALPSDLNKAAVGSSYIEFSRNEMKPFLARVLAFIEKLPEVSDEKPF